MKNVGVCNQVAGVWGGGSSQYRTSRIELEDTLPNSSQVTTAVLIPNSSIAKTGTIEDSSQAKG